MSKFDIFNKIKIDLDKYEEIEDNDKDELKKQIQDRLKFSKRSLEKKRKYKMKKIAVCASLTGILLCSFNINSLANRVPFIKDVYKELRHSEKADRISTNFNKYFDDNLQKVNQTVKANGKTVTLESILCDGKNIALSYIVKSDDKFENDGFGTQLRSNCKVKINNTSDYEFYSLGIEGDYIDDNTFVGTELLQLENKKSLPNQFDMYVVFDNIDGEFWDKEVNYLPEDLWEFKFKVKSNTSNNKFIQVNKAKSKFIVSSVEVRPLSLVINDIRPKDSKDTVYDVIIYDDKGNIVDESTQEPAEVYEKDNTKSKVKTTYKALDKDCKYIKIVYKELKLIPNPDAPGYIDKEKENIEDVVFKIDLN